MSIQVKVCGLTRAEDVDACAAAGVEYIGFVFAPSPRRVSPSLAARLERRVPAGCKSVGLFMNQRRSTIETVLSTVELDWLQFHGRETEAFCRAFGLPYVKAISMFEGEGQRGIEAYPNAAGILLDSHAPGGGGGTGRSFDWSNIPAIRQPLWLAGGLNPLNVAIAVRQVRPQVVDVSSGVEDAPGIKNPTLINQFVQIARQESNEAGS